MEIIERLRDWVQDKKADKAEIKAYKKQAQSIRRRAYYNQSMEEEARYGKELAKLDVDKRLKREKDLMREVPNQQDGFEIGGTKNDDVLGLKNVFSGNSKGKKEGDILGLNNVFGGSKGREISIV